MSGFQNYIEWTLCRICIPNAHPLRYNLSKLSANYVSVAPIIYSPKEVSSVFSLEKTAENTGEMAQEQANDTKLTEKLMQK